MREGLHWSTDSIWKEPGYVDASLENETDHVKKSWTLARHYYLLDLGGDAFWVGKLVVFARQLKVLSHFRVETLTPDMVHGAYAARSDARNQICYSYEVDGKVRLNALYDDMPLTGWWPWPKRQSAKQTGEDAEEETEEEGGE
ncbi:hypothetical protein CTRI78_v010213 [Colletotrichum trifolii]|uniref:Uncharacterized protein n=1 Tax=Colletotrichum trifolii TaxID=5466 RepID=A0A4R8QQN7_COLTR|nr:hypothetical protein CTRI78_v010213 [Colletotrichum trifolii]